MFPRSLNDRFESMIDELIEHGGLDSASLASILTTVQDSMNQGYCAELSRRLWMLSNELRSADADEDSDAVAGVNAAGPATTVLPSFDALRTNRQAV